MKYICNLIFYSLQGEGGIGVI